MSQQPSLNSSPAIPGSVLCATGFGGTVFGNPQVFQFALTGTTANTDSGNNDYVGPVVALLGGVFTSCHCQMAGIPVPVSGVIMIAAEPIGAPVIVDILRLTDGGQTWTSLWPTNPGNRPQVAVGATSGVTTAFDAAPYNVGDMFVCMYISGTVVPSGNGTVVPNAAVIVTLR